VPTLERAAPGGPQGRLELPGRRRGPFVKLGVRLAAGIALLAFVTLVAYLDRGGYRDAAGDRVSFLDCLYYSTVSVTTTGYGDITPVSDRARLLTTIFVTPARVLFLIVLVGTTVEILAESSRAAFRERNWRKRLKDHIIVVGYGTKGRAALEVLRGHGRSAREVVVVDPASERVAEAGEHGYAAIHGDASRAAVLDKAEIAEAAVVIVAADRDDSAVLITLTAREKNPRAKIVAAVREDENRHLLHQSGADSVITSSGAAGRLLGFAALSPQVVEVLEDLLSVGSGLDIVERAVAAEHVGRPLSAVPSDAPVVAVVRGEDLLRFDDPRTRLLENGDRLVCLCSNA
jgi:voltage-gated potassium channel